MSEKANCEKLNMYSELYVESFKEAVDFLWEKTSEFDNKFCLVDIDGTLLSNQLTKLPGICHFVSSAVPQEIGESFNILKTEVFTDNNIVIATNRNRYERVFWNSNEILKNVVDTCGVPVVTSLNRQFPGLAKKKCDELVGRIVEYGICKRDLKIYVIEDFSIICPNRRNFLNYISNRVQRELGIEVGVVNLVIKS